MKALLVLRHAKAQPDAPAGDHRRELTGRGQRDAAAIGSHIRDVVGPPDAIVSSDARRAWQTAEAVATATGFTAPLTSAPEVYGAGLTTLIQVVQRLPDEAERVVLVGHNPGFEELVAALAADGDGLITLPTAGLAHLDFDLAHWSDVRSGAGQWRGLVTPKTL